MNVWNRRDLDYGTNATTILGPNTVREPDSWVRPKHRPRPPPLAADNDGRAYPTMMIEVGYAQSLPDLHRTACHCFNQRTNIQIVLVIKIFGVITNVRNIALTANLL